MAQWDVYVNPSPRMRDVLPYVVVLQSDLLDPLDTRLVAPLARRLHSRSATPNRLPQRLSPRLEVAGESLELLIQELAPMPARVLRDPVVNLRGAAHKIIDALDTVISGV
jgi:toxin CcdB